MSIFASVWDAAWLFFWVFVFFAYLMTLFAVVGDLIRDRSLRGVWKALWIIALISVPLLTVLIYVIARGDGMARRGAAAAQAQQDSANDYIRTVAGTSAADEIARAKALLDAGTISEQEYQALKAKALS